MPRFDLEYTFQFFKHFQMHVENFEQISTARKDFYSNYGIHVSFSEVYQGYRHSHKVFSIYNMNSKQKSWYSDFETMVSDVTTKGKNLIISMPRNLKRHKVILQNNAYRRIMKQKIGFYPIVKYSPYGQHVIRLHVVGGFTKEPQLVKQIATILNNFEEIDGDIQHLMTENANYRIIHRPPETIFFIYRKIDDLEMVLTNLRFAGITISKNVEIYTTEEFYE